jgi:hypothetical protein
MEPERIGDATPRIVFGLLLFALGVLFLLDKLDLVEMGRLWDYWPLVFVGAGLGKVMQPAGAPGRATGAIFIAVGVWWLLANLGVVDRDPADLWPVVLMAIGASMLWRAIGAAQRPSVPVAPPPFPGDPPAAAGPALVQAAREAAGTVPTGYEADARLDAVGILGGVARKSAARDFRGGSMTAIMGGCEIDLRHASIASGEAAIDAFALWGGVEIKVPRDWLVVSKGMPLLGGFADSTTPPPSPTGKVLVVRGMAIMGGVEIKN